MTWASGQAWPPGIDPFDIFPHPASILWPQGSGFRQAVGQQRERVLIDKIRVFDAATSAAIAGLPRAWPQP
jgi:hypothetical protein